MEPILHDRIDELLVKYLAEEATPPEEQEVLNWLRADAANQHYFEHFKTIWEASADALPDIDVTKSWQKFQRIQKKGQIKVSRQPVSWMRIAASILLVAGIAAITYLLMNKKESDPAMLAVTTADEVKTDTLPDGSVATLNKHSSIAYPSAFKGDRRKVALRGEAFFNVTPDKEKPFIIEVNDVAIKVIGTSFNVRSNGEATEVIVETGVVQVIRDGQMVELRAGERTLLQPAAGDSLSKQVSDDKLYNYYISHTFICDNTPLWKLAEKLSEAYSVNFVFENKSLRSLPLTVTFDQESLDVILKIISQTLGVQTTRQGNTITIY